MLKRQDQEDTESRVDSPITSVIGNDRAKNRQSLPWFRDRITGYIGIRSKISSLRYEALEARQNWKFVVESSKAFADGLGALRILMRVLSALPELKF